MQLQYSFKSCKLQHNKTDHICASTICGRPDCRKISLISAPLTKPSRSVSALVNISSYWAFSTAVTTHLPPAVWQVHTNTTTQNSWNSAARRIASGLHVARITAGRIASLKNNKHVIRMYRYCVCIQLGTKPSGCWKTGKFKLINA